jgi:hypothetical protein
MCTTYDKERKEEVHHVEDTKAVMWCCFVVVPAAKSQLTDMVVDPDFHLAKSRERALHEHSS